jgi:adenylate cyclase
MEATPDLPEPSSRACLRQLLSERNQYPERAAEIDARVHRAFGRKVAILALDMCGFSRLTAEYGIIHFLAMIHQMEQGAIPAVTGNGGKIIKVEADNLFAIFEQPAHALEAALDIFRAFEAINAVVPKGRDIRGSIGIGYGEVLVVADEDVFGAEMNLASKLGEDVAAGMEILLTTAAHDLLPEGHYEFAADSCIISGVVLPFHRFQRCIHHFLLGKTDGKAAQPGVAVEAGI